NMYAFRTPSLLNVMDTGPWGHAGAFEDIEALLQYHADPSVHALRFSLQDILDLSQFRTQPLTELSKEHYQDSLVRLQRILDTASFRDIAQPLLPNRPLEAVEI